MKLPPEFIDRPAFFSPCGNYRYGLRRDFAPLMTTRLNPPRPCVFCMLNPSIADDLTDDPTIRRCIDFARRWGHTCLFVVNVFAWRATDPNDLRGAPDPIGPLNDDAIRLAFFYARNFGGRVIVAWGANRMAARRARRIIEIADQERVRLECLGHKTLHADPPAPKHPLYLKKSTEPTPWPPFAYSDDA